MDTPKKNKAAVALGRKGGKATKGMLGIAKGLSKLSEERRKEIAAKGVAARRANAKKRLQNSIDNTAL